MKIYWVAVREYGNGQFVNKIYPFAYLYYSTCEVKCNELNRKYPSEGERWVPFPVILDTSVEWLKEEVEE